MIQWQQRIINNHQYDWVLNICNDFSCRLFDRRMLRLINVVCSFVFLRCITRIPNDTYTMVQAMRCHCSIDPITTGSRPSILFQQVDNVLLLMHSMLWWRWCQLYWSSMKPIKSNSHWICDQMNEKKVKSIWHALTMFWSRIFCCWWCCCNISWIIQCRWVGCHFRSRSHSIFINLAMRLLLTHIDLTFIHKFNDGHQFGAILHHVQ